MSYPKLAPIQEKTFRDIEAAAVANAACPHLQRNGKKSGLSEKSVYALVKSGCIRIELFGSHDRRITLLKGCHTGKMTALRSGAENLKCRIIERDPFAIPKLVFPSDGGEKWKKAPAYPDYAVSNFGRVMRIAKGGSNATKPGKLLSLKSKGRYVRLALYRGDKVHYVSLHRLVLEAFVGQPPTNNHVAAHWDNNGQNNRLDNLRWATPKENAADRIRHGTVPSGVHHPNSCLTKEQVNAIRKIAKRGIGFALLAAAVGVGESTMARVVRGRSYR